uniref:Centromere protein F n=1 Tax=Sarcophilus harrisii TaxID=9305 RepID=A0A7N4NIB2_SARHA
METCENLEKMRQKISHELQVKESQVNFQEGQLNSSKKQIEKLEQELKRYKSELERNQLAVLPGDVSTLNSTPQKSSAPPVQSSQSASRYEELQEKYSKEVEERKRLEEEVKALQIKKASKTVPPNNMSHREIARHQSSSSVFPWQQEKTPTRHSANAQETPFRRGFTALHVPWEQETTPNRMPSWQDTNCSFHENPSDPHLLDQIKAQNQELRFKVNELEHRLQGQEKDIKGHMNKWQETQLHLEKTKLELVEKEKVLNKTRDELMRLTTQFDQATAKCTTLEQKLKKISEDLSCQRQNAESTRCALEQKIKDKEKDYQEELSHQQRTFQMLDQESTQIKTRLNQELQQAKSTQNILQAELDKVVAVKQQLERNSDEFKQKLSRTEQALQTSETKENELRKNLEEMMQEKQLFSHQLDKRTREVYLLEEELKKTKYCLKQNQNLAEEMKEKNATQGETLKALQEKIDQQEKSFILEKLKLAVADLEKQRDCSQDLLKKREHHIEQLNDKLSATQKETYELLSTLELKEKECEDLKKETIIFSQWKSEKEPLLNQLLLEKEGLEGKINHLELCLKTQQMKNHDANESFKVMETEKENLGLEIRKLQNAIEVKSIELETQKRAYDELQEKSECSEQKYKKEIENLSLKILQVTEEDEHLKQKLQLISSEIIEKDQRYEELCIQYKRINSLVKSQNICQMTSDDHCGDLLTFEEPVTNNSFTNILEFQGSLPLERGSQKIKLCSGDESLKSAALLHHEVSSFQFSVESEKQMNTDSQKHCEELVPIEGKIEENIFKAEHMHECFVNKQFQMLSEQAESGQVEDEDLKTNKLSFEKSVKELQLMSETLNSEKKEINSDLFQNKKEIEELTQENRNLKEINAILNIEKMNLIQKNVDFSNCLIQKENNISELSDRNMEEKLLLVKRCEEAEKELELLKEKYKSLEKKNTEMGCILSDHSLTLFGDRNNELKDLEGAFAREREYYIGKLALAEEKNEKLIFEMETIQCGLRTENAAIQNSSKIEADCLRQEISNFKHEQNKIQEQYHDLLQENGRLMKLIKAKDVQMNALVLTGSSASEQMSESENQSENETDNFKMIKVEMFPINLDAKDSSINTCNPQVVRLEEVIKHMELRLKESEKEKEFLQKELEMIRKELEIRDSKVMEAKQYDQSFETNSYEDCKREMDEKYISVLHELSTSQNDNAQLMTSLQGAVNKLNELEKMCDILQIEKLKLTSELNDSKSECILATTKMAEKMEKLVTDIKTLNNKNSNLPGDFNERNDKDKFGEQSNEQMSVSLKLLESNIEAGGDYEHLKLSNKEVQMHFFELQEKFSSLEVEHRILHEQHCGMNSKLSELCSYIDTLKTENSVLSMNLKNLQTDLMKQCSPDNEEFALEEGGSLSSSCMNEIPNLTSFVESSFYKDLFEEPRETSSNSLEETILNSQSSTNIHETSLSSSVVECISKKIARSDPSLNIEEIKTLCQTYQISLKNLVEKYQRQENIKDKEIQELKQLIGSERKELQSLREQYLAENEQWQQKLTNVTVEMESKLAAEKKQTEYLSLQLEVARLQLQGLDLSSRSFLIAESEDAITDDQGNSVSDNSEEHNSFTDEKIIKSDSLHICEENVQQILHLESEKIAENEGVSSAAICSRKLNLENEYRNPLDKTLNNSECIHELSFSSNDTTVAMDFLENQVLIQNLQTKLKETSNENLKLIRGIEESNKKVDSLLSRIKELDYELDLQKTELTAKICKCSELEKAIQELQKEKVDLSDKLESLSYDNHQLLQRVTSFENLNSCLAPDKVIFTDATDIEENIAVMSKDWKEQFLEIENELKRVKSEKTNIENHAISIEGDLEELQRKNLSLEKDNDNKQKMVSNLDEQLSLVIAEKNHLSGELEIVLKAKMQIEEICEKLKEKIEVLESNQRESLQHVEIMESEVRDKTQLLQSMTCHVNQLLKDKEDLQEQLQNLEKDKQKLSLIKDNIKHEFGQLTNEKELLIRELENMKSKLNESEAENVNLSKVLESSLIEKGEIAARLNSTQEEVHQLRTGIEKLKIRIEADEKKKHYVLEKLKESERNADSFKDKVEALERELQMSEENQEAVILDAESTKSELETLKTQMEELTKGLKCSELELFALRSKNNTEIINLRAEKENILKELQEKQDQVSQLEQLAYNLKFVLSLSSEENIVKEIQENTGQGFELENLIQTLNCLKSELVDLKSEKENALKELQVKENRVSELEELVQNLRYEEPEVVTSISEKGNMLKNLQASREETSQLEEWGKTSKCLESELITLRLEKENMLIELQKKQNRLSELEASNQTLKHLETELIALNLEKENLSKALVEEKQSKVVEFEKSNNNLKLMETEIFALRSEKENILKELHETQSRVSELEELTQNLNCVETYASLSLEKERMSIELQENSDHELEELAKNLKSLEMEVVVLREEKENMSKNQQENHLIELEKLTQTIKYLESELAALREEKESISNEVLKEKQYRVCELEELTKSLKCLEIEVVSLRSEKESILKELQKKQSEVSELEELTKTLRCVETEVVSLRSEKDNVLKELQENQDQIYEFKELIESLKCVETEVIALRSEKEYILKELKEKQDQVCQLEESIKILKCLETELALLRSEKESTLRELQENHYQVFELRELVQILKCLDSELISTKLEKENVLKDLQVTQDQVSELENLTINLKDLETEVVSLRLEKENMLKELQEKQSQVSELEGLTTNLKVLESEVAFLKSENKDVLKELQKKQDETRELQELTIKLKCLESEIISLNSEKENTLKELQKKQSEMSELEELIKSLNSLESKVASLKSEKDNMLKELQAERDQICELKEVNINLKYLETEVVSLRLVKESMSRELEEKQSQVSEFEQLTKSLRSLETEFASLTTEKENLLKQLCELEESTKNLENEVVSLLSEKESILKELQAKEGQVSDLEELTKSLRSLEPEVTSLRSEKESMSKELKEKQSHICELKEITSNLKCLEIEVAALRLEKENMLKALQEKQDHICELEEMTKNLKCLESELAAFKSEKDSMLKDLQEKQDRICELEEMTKNLKCLESELAAFKSEKDSMLKDLQEKQDQICELEEINASLKCLETEIISLRLAKESMLKELEEKQSQISELEQLTKNLKCVESEVASLTSEKENLLKKLCELEESTKNLKCLENEVVSLSSEKENILKELQEKQGQVSDLEDLTKSLRSLEPEIASLRSQKESMSKELKEKQNRICELEEMSINLKCLETEVVSLSSDKENILKELQEKQDQIAELKMLNVSFESLLEKKEEEKRKLKEESNHTVELLQKQLNDLNEKIETLHEENNICKVNEHDLNCQVDCLKNEKIHLMQQLEENKNNNALLKSSMNDLIQETENNKQKLEKETEENRILQKQVEDLRKLSSMLTQMEAQQQLWEKEKLQMKSLIVELQEKIKELSKNETLYDSLEALQCSYANLEKELESTKRENSSLLEQINKMTHNEVLLKKEMNEMMQKMTVLQEEYAGEKNRFTDHVKITEAEAEKNKMQLDELILEKCELKKSLDCLQKELEEREGKSRDEISDYQCRLENANKKYEALLKEANKKHEMEIEAYQEKLICKEQDLSLHKSEMEILKSNKEELTKSLKSTSKILEELKKTKMDNMKYVTQLKKENENAKGKIQLLIKTCKQLENEKEALQKEITGFEALQENQKQNNAPGVNVEELMSEVKELKETIEEKNKETDEYLDKYCNLLVSYEKLEKTKDMLEAQVTFLSSLQGKVTSQSSPMLNSADSIHSPNYPVPEKKTSASQSKVSNKRPRSCGIKENDGESMSSTPETFTKRIKKGVTPKGITSLSRGLENIEYEPEGLPEVVKKGFADIPKGKTSPYVFRRTTLATRASPRLAAQKLSPLNLQKGQSENLAETSKPTAGGSRSQKAKDDHQHQVQSLVTIIEPTTRSPLSENNLSKKTSADIPKESMRTKRVKHSPSKHTVPEQNKEDNCRVQ